LKETDRLTAVKTELEKAGVSVDITDDSMHVTGKINRDLLSSVVFETYDDHRMAMSLAMLAALNKSITINDPDVVNKSYPGFFDELMKLK
jgi:3-phosphoshikimate 1-carboxyvinyltransferase